MTSTSSLLPPIESSAFRFPSVSSPHVINQHADFLKVSWKNTNPLYNQCLYFYFSPFDCHRLPLLHHLNSIPSISLSRVRYLLFPVLIYFSLFVINTVLFFKYQSKVKIMNFQFPSNLPHPRIPPELIFLIGEGLEYSFEPRPPAPNICPESFGTSRIARTSWSA